MLENFYIYCHIYIYVRHTFPPKNVFIRLGAFCSTTCSIVKPHDCLFVFYTKNLSYPQITFYSYEH